MSDVSSALARYVFRGSAAIRAGLLAAPKAAVLGGLTAATLWSMRGPLAGPGDPVEVVLPPGVRWHPGPGVIVRTATTTGDVVTDDALRYTDRTRTALDLVRRGHVDDAVVLLDRLVHYRVAFLDDVRKAAARLPRCRGSSQARRVATLADGLAESPPETRLRLLIHRAGLPAPVAQFTVRHGGVRSHGSTSATPGSDSRSSTTAPGTAARTN